MRFDNQMDKQVEHAWEEISKRRREKWAAVTRARLAGQQGWRCCYCRVEMDVEQNGPDSATLAHIITTIRGGARYDENNLAVACRDCHMLRGDALWPMDIQTITWMTAEALKADYLKSAA